jgi:hypothetical protein
MTSRTRQTILLILGILVIGLLAAWWYSGFSLEFMRFFASEPTPTVSPCVPPAMIWKYLPPKASLLPPD